MYNFLLDSMGKKEGFFMTIAIRNARAQDAEAVAAIEALCFPAAEAASAQTIAARIAAFPSYFFVAEQHGALIGFVNGCVTNSPINVVDSNRSRCSTSAGSAGDSTDVGVCA